MLGNQLTSLFTEKISEFRNTALAEHIFKNLAADYIKEETN